MSIKALFPHRTAFRPSTFREVANARLGGPFPLVKSHNASTHVSDKRAGDAKARRQSFKGKGGGDNLMAPVKKDKHPGAFRPLPAAQLTHPLLQTERKTLDLPAFHHDVVGSSDACRFRMDGKDAIEVWGVPKNLVVEFRILSAPCSVIRGVTRTVADMLDTANLRSSLETRVVITGKPGCGKSFLLLQAVEYCSSKNWIVLYIPRAVNLVNSTTSYAYDLRTQTYFQPAFASQTLQRVLSANEVALGSLHTQRELTLDRRNPITVGTPLPDLINVGVKEPSISPVILTALMEELGLQNKHPVLLAVDDFQALYCKTAYRDAHFTPIRSYHLSMPRLILEYASGKKSFARGAVLGAISTSPAEYQLPVELREALDLEYDKPTGPWAKRSPTMIEYAKGLRKFPVPEQLTVSEAATIFDIWMKDRAIHSSANDELFLSKYTEASGNARNFVWKGLLSTLGGT